MTEEKKAGFKRTRYTQGQVLRNPAYDVVIANLFCEAI